MERRDFIKFSTFAGMGLSLAPLAMFSSCNRGQALPHSAEFKKLCYDLLKDWCDGLIKTQIIKPSDPTVHGAFDCPACEHIHARVMDAVYPFFYMAQSTGDKKYLNAGIAAFEWGKNVSREDGAWTNGRDPKSWDGTTVFAAVALAETLHYHGDLLDEARRQRWYARLEKAIEFVYHRFPVIGNANINYGATTIYALNMIGRLLNNPKYITRSRELAEQIKGHFTQPNYFLFAEKQGKIRLEKSPKGLYGIDLGYNAEESLNNLVFYALAEKDEDFLGILQKSLDTHMSFIIPDGGLDNSFGNRIYKWSYWGSRTSDGMQPAFGMMAGYHPAYGTVAFKNTELLKQCTSDGLLHGGLHYSSHGIKPCVHHTFAHAKPLAFMLEHWNELPEINKETPLPRAVADGVQYFEELDVSLFGRGDWRGTISAYDAEYNPHNDCRQATGASLSLLYHNTLGLLCTASMAVYRLQEANNQQPAPGEDIALTPRIECYKNATWYTNIYDRTATYKVFDDGKTIAYQAKVQLKDEKQKLLSGTAADFQLEYLSSKQKMKIIASTKQLISETTAFVLPIVSPTGETVTQLSETLITIKKPEGTLKVSSSVKLRIKNMPKSRTFNMIPGVEALPLVADFEAGNSVVELTLEVL